MRNHAPVCLVFLDESFPKSSSPLMLAFCSIIRQNLLGNDAYEA